MILLRIGLVIILGGIAYLSLTPSTSVSVGNDKLGHFIAYSVLTINIGLITLHSSKQLLIGIIGALAYGALMEWGQSFVPGRSVSFYDMIANATGVAIGTLVILILGKRLRKIFVK